MSGNGSEPPDPYEATLVQAAQGGDLDAFDEIVRLNMDRAWSIALRVAGNRADAEDLVQDSFIAALRGLPGFDASRPFAPWLARIVFNRGLNMRKARALRIGSPLTDDLPAACVSPLESAERSELRSALAAALASLPEQRRQMLELFEVDGFTSREVAEITGVAEGTVRWHVHQAKAALREVLSRHRKTVA